MAKENITSTHLTRNTIGGSIGNVLEWYDFAVFGYFAPLIGSQFFPSENPTASLIKAFGVFAAGYLMRPLGGVVFGYIGDRMGRKKALELSVAMMALPTTILGLLPTYETVGILAPILLVLLRLIQGVSVGGELIGSMSFISEIAPPNKRGFYGSWTLFSATGGVMVGSLIATIAHAVFPAHTLTAWGWRLPFLAGFLIGLFGLWMRRDMPETPEFKQLREEGEVTANPILEVLRHHSREIAHVAALVAIMGGGFYMLFVWWPTYLTKMVKPPIFHALLVNTIAMLLYVGLIPLVGLLSDRIGRKVILAFAGLMLAVLAYPLFCWTDHSIFAGALAAQLTFALFMSGTAAPLPAAMVEMFPARTRFSGVAIGYNITLGVVGGTAPLVSTWLVSLTGDIAAPAYYLIALALVSFTAALFLKKKQEMTENVLAEEKNLATAA